MRNESRLSTASGDRPELIGRERELARIRSARESAQGGRGGLLLISGEAGVGKTRLVRAALGSPNVEHLYARADKGATPPYGPLLSCLRQFLRHDPDGLAPLGPLLPYLARLLPELGEAEDADVATQSEALLAAFDLLAECGTSSITLDDLQWADNATLEFLPHLAQRLRDKPVLMFGIYRADEIPRDHALRRTRTELRRAHLLHEISLESLDEEQTAALAHKILGQHPGPDLARLLHQRSMGVPMFVEELCTALAHGTSLQEGQQGLELAEGQEIPLPETVRDAALIRVADLSAEARDLLEIAAVAGHEFGAEVVRSLADREDGLEELFERGILVDKAPGRTGFRQSLARDALYEEIAWSRRRELHRELARRLEGEGGPLRVIAEHYLAGRELETARKTLVASAERSCELYAYRDAIEAIETALEIWPEGKDEELRVGALDTLASCAELSGMPQRAARAWREIAAAAQDRGDLHKYAEVNRNLARLHELQGAWEQAQTSRLEAAEAFAAARLPGEAAAERLAVAGHLHGAGRYDAALELTTLLVEEAEAAGRHDLLARGLGLRGALQAKLGDLDEGRASAQQGLSLALQHDLTSAAADVYQRLAGVGEQASEYDSAIDTYHEAFQYCDQHDIDGQAKVCLGCLSVVLQQTGDWGQAEQIARQVLESDDVPHLGRAVACSVLGAIEASRGRLESARRLLSESYAIGRFHDLVTVEMAATWGLALVHESEGRVEAVSRQCQHLLELWSGTEERHYAIPKLRWAATWYARQKDGAGARACADALSRIAAAGNPEALAGLAHALGEVALVEDDLDYAVEQFRRALDLLTELDIPYELAATRLRLGTAHIEAGRHDEGIEQLVRAHRAARELGARDLTKVIGAKLEEIGEPLEEHLGRRAAQRLEHAGLTKRQMEVLELVAQGLTNRQVADELVLSPRTVDMHVSNILGRLDCRSRTEAVKRATELGLLGEN